MGDECHLGLGSWVFGVHPLALPLPAVGLPDARCHSLSVSWDTPPPLLVMPPLKDNVVVLVDDD